MLLSACAKYQRAFAYNGNQQRGNLFDISLKDRLHSASLNGPEATLTFITGGSESHKFHAYLHRNYDWNLRKKLRSKAMET
jgi:hypothetical protein